MRPRGRAYRIVRSKHAYFTYPDTHTSTASSRLVVGAPVLVQRCTHLKTRGNTIKSIIKVTKTQTRRTVLFVWREVEGTHTSEGEAVSARAGAASLPLWGASCGRTQDRHTRAPAPHAADPAPAPSLHRSRRSCSPAALHPRSRAAAAPAVARAAAVLIDL